MDCGYDYSVSVDGDDDHNCDGECHVITVLFMMVLMMVMMMLLEKIYKKKFTSHNM